MFVLSEMTKPDSVGIMWDLINCHHRLQNTLSITTGCLFHQFPCSKYMTPVLEHWNLDFFAVSDCMPCFQPPNTKAQVCILCVGAIELLHPLRTSQRNCRAHRTCPLRNVSCLQMSVVWSSHGSLAIFQAWSAKRNTSADQYQRAPDVIKWDQSRYDNKKGRRRMKGVCKCSNHQSPGKSNVQSCGGSSSGTSG